MADDNSVCNICAEPYNRQTRHVTKCPGCDHECCSVCVQRYLDTSKNEPQCMQCHRPWNNQFVMETFGATALRHIVQAKKDNLFQSQKSLLPHTQHYVNLLGQSEEVDREMAELKTQLHDIKLQLAHLQNRQGRLNRQKQRIEQDFLAYTNDANGESVQSTSTVEEGKVVYLRPCGKNECKGFISSKGVCGICKTEYCRKCLVEKLPDQEHVCDPNDVLSLEAIKKDSKPCPSCSTMIHRISGCPDMFCTSCFTAFNWNNLRIDRNGNSNPMYYRWIREGAGTNFRDLPQNCNNIHLSHVFRSVNFRNIPRLQVKLALEKAIQALHHTEQKISRYYQNTSSNFESATLLARARYMMNKSSEDNFKNQLMRINKAREYNDNIQQSCNLITGYRNDMMYNIVYTDDFDPIRFLREFVEFANYMNNCYQHIRNVFYKNTRSLNDTLITIPKNVDDVLNL